MQVRTVARRDRAPPPHYPIGFIGREGETRITRPGAKRTWKHNLFHCRVSPGAASVGLGGPLPASLPPQSRALSSHASPGGPHWGQTHYTRSEDQ